MRPSDPQLILELDVAQENYRNALFHREFGACVKRSSKAVFSLPGGRSLFADMATPANETDRNDQIEDAPSPSNKTGLSRRALNWLFGYDYFIAHHD
jgi:hypothetical protein